MIEWRRLLLPILLILPPLLCSAAPALAAAPIASASFCKTRFAFDASSCRPMTVELPHHWVDDGSSGEFGLYRFEIPRSVAGEYGLLIERLALDGAVRVNGATVLDKLDPARLTRQRYWPQMAGFTVAESADKPIVIEVAVRGLPQVKSGLGSLTIADPATIASLYQRQLTLDVVLLAVLATASFVAGIVGIVLGGHQDRTARVLSATAMLSMIAALRCAYNLVTEPPFDMLAWNILGLWLLALVGLHATHVVIAYLSERRDWNRHYLLATMIMGAILFASYGTSVTGDIANALFVATLIAAMFLIIKLAGRVRRDRDWLGAWILSAFAILIIVAIHDLTVHFSSASVSDRYLQSWSVPALVVLSVLALAKKSAGQRDLERALQQATARREDLLRDLHDRVGSRLVALAFHAQQRSTDQTLVDEIRALMNELRLIQSTVGAEPTTLESLLADLRHLFSRIGGGRLPLRWSIDESSSAVRVTADQAIAIARIIEESVANAMTHAAPTVIGIELTRNALTGELALDVADDGKGDFRPNPSGGGLNNMRSRAAQAGLRLEFARDDGLKRVRIHFEQRSVSAWRRLIDRLPHPFSKSRVNRNPREVSRDAS